MNARNEFLGHVEGKNIKCAVIHARGKPMILGVDGSPDVMSTFLAALDFTYDSGFGGQDLFGYIWFMDGTWSERHEYAGSERWVHKQCPDFEKVAARYSQAKSEWELY